MLVGLRERTNVCEVMFRAGNSLSFSRQDLRNFLESASTQPGDDSEELLLLRLLLLLLTAQCLSPNLTANVVVRMHFLRLRLLPPISTYSVVMA